MTTFLPALSRSQQEGNVIIRRGMVDDDLFMAGAQVVLYAAVNGDAVITRRKVEY